MLMGRTAKGQKKTLLYSAHFLTWHKVRHLQKKKFQIEID